MNWLVRGWSLLMSAKSARTALKRAVTLAQQVRSTVQNAATAELQDLRQRAEAGDRLAQYDLGETYYTGAGVPRDFAEAAKWFRLSAENGYVKAQATLGMLYAAGQGVDRDYTEALRWIGRAAAKNDPAAIRFREKLLKRMKPEEIEAARQSPSAGHVEDSRLGKDRQHAR